MTAPLACPGGAFAFIQESEFTQARPTRATKTASWAFVASRDTYKAARWWVGVIRRGACKTPVEFSGWGVEGKCNGRGGPHGHIRHKTACEMGSSSRRASGGEFVFCRFSRTGYSPSCARLKQARKVSPETSGPSRAAW